MKKIYNVIVKLSDEAKRDEFKNETAIFTDIKLHFADDKAGVKSLKKKIAAVEGDTLSYFNLFFLRKLYRDLKSAVVLGFSQHTCFFLCPGDDLFSVIVMIGKQACHSPKFFEYPRGTFSVIVTI